MFYIKMRLDEDAKLETKPVMTFEAIVFGGKKSRIHRIEVKIDLPRVLEYRMKSDPNHASATMVRVELPRALDSGVTDTNPVSASNIHRVGLDPVSASDTHNIGLETVNKSSNVFKTEETDKPILTMLNRRRRRRLNNIDPSQRSSIVPVDLQDPLDAHLQENTDETGQTKLIPKELLELKMAFKRDLLNHPDTLGNHHQEKADEPGRSSQEEEADEPGQEKPTSMILNRDLLELKLAFKEGAPLEQYLRNKNKTIREDFTLRDILVIIKN